MIEGAIGKTGQGVEISRKVLETLNEIVTKVRQVDELVSEVAGASREQTQGITQISSAVGQMDKVTQSNAANAEESAAAAEQLNAQAETMRQSVMELLELVGGNCLGADSPTPGHAVPRSHGTRSRRTCEPPVHQNGHAAPKLATASATNGRGGIPLEGDFKDL
jgi:hypothetical protein